ncbi:MAG: BamA/TamA family outer membrane protein [Spirochaetes bacterium]|nr:BamA/TamA family outer membrane protein [Spirochaetota bacterium]
MITNRYFTVFTKKLFGLLTLSAVFLTASVSHAQETDIDMVAFPIIESSPDTGFVLGALGMLLFTPKDDSNLKSDEIELMGWYSIRNQYESELSYKKHIANGRFYNYGSFLTSYYPTVFYGTGSKTSNSETEIIEPETYSVVQGIVYSISENLYAGLNYRFIYFDVNNIKNGGIFEREELTGITNTYVSSPGLTVIYDTRNSEYYPSQGFYAEFDFSVNNNMFGASNNCTRTSVDLRHFLNIYKNEYILGLQFKAVNQSGEIPFALYEGIGGEELLRGYPVSRYIDKCKYGAQTEFRYPLFFLHSLASRNLSFLRNFSGAIFTGFGNVAPTITDFKTKTTRFAYGIGIRYAVIEEEKINLKIDFTMNRENEFDFYIGFKEAF